MTAFLITNARVFDGTGAAPYPAEVLVEGNRIVAVAEQVPLERVAGATVVDAGGGVVMPGLTDGHTHLGFLTSTEHTATRLEPLEEKAMLIAHCGRVMLDHGFTSCYSGGNRLPQAEASARKAFAEGWMPGPRLRSASWEGSSGFVSPNHYEYPGVENRDPDPEAIRVFVHSMADLGADIVKLTLTGESALIENTSRILQFTEEEVAAAAEAARERGVWLTAHAHSAEAVSIAARNGIRAIYHASFCDEGAIEALVAVKDRVFVAPTPGIIYAHLNDENRPVTEGMETRETKESISRVAPELYRRGVRLVIGGDYGFPINPIGKNARDLRLFVEWFGLTPAEALRCATEFGGQIMGMGDELGLVKEGYLADLLIVDGDPTTDITLMEDPANFALIMKDGAPHKLNPSRVREAAAAGA